MDVVDVIAQGLRLDHRLVPMYLNNANSFTTKHQFIHATPSSHCPQSNKLMDSEGKNHMPIIVRTITFQTGLLGEEYHCYSNISVFGIW